jgi:hypothetical protein
MTKINFKITPMEEYKKSYIEQDKEKKEILIRYMDKDMTMICKIIDYVRDNNLIQDELLEEMSDGFYETSEEAYKEALITLTHANYLSRWKLESDCEVGFGSNDITKH